MPGLIGSQGIRPGALNMNRVFRALRYRTEQAQLVTYHRPPIYDTDSYGVPTGSLSDSSTTQELLLPDLPAIIRPAVTADYAKERAGNNIIGAARIYTPNITTIKNYSNFDQANNIDFNEIEGWDRLITNYRTIYSVPTSATGSWSTGGSATFTSDGESLTTTLTGLFSNAITFTPSSPVNTLEADRMRFKVKASGSVTLRYVASYNGGSTADHYVLWDASPDFVLLDDNWLTIDVPFTSGTSSTSIYQTGSRNPVTVTTGSSFDYEGDMNKISFDFSGDTNDTIQIKEVEFYKSVSWHVHSLKDMTDGYIIFNCVRTRGRSDSKRRAYS